LLSPPGAIDSGRPRSTLLRVARLPRRGVAPLRSLQPRSRAGRKIIEPTSHRTGAPDPSGAAPPRPAASPPRLALWLATAGPAGYAPVAPGTAGAAVGVVLYLPLSYQPLLFAAVTAGLLGAGVWSAGVAERAFGTRDDGRIVIDEVVGQLLTLAPLVAVASEASVRSPWLLLTGFLLFRLLDIWKPGPVAWGERRFAGGAGVMLDDVIAGGLGALVLGSLYVAGVGFGLCR
jgi:phosphatidylglycerophosphatase A